MLVGQKITCTTFVTLQNPGVGGSVNSMYIICDSTKPDVDGPVNNVYINFVTLLSPDVDGSSK